MTFLGLLLGGVGLSCSRAQEPVVPPPATTSSLGAVGDGTRVGAELVVLPAGTAVYRGPDLATYEGRLDDAERPRGWTFRKLSTRDGFVEVSSDLGGMEACAPTVAGLDGVTVWVAEDALAQVLERDVELSTEGCPTVRAARGLMVTEVCTVDGQPRFQVGGCPSADCAYDVHPGMLARSYRPRVEGAGACLEEVVIEAPPEEVEEIEEAEEDGVVFPGARWTRAVEEEEGPRFGGSLRRGYRWERLEAPTCNDLEYTSCAPPLITGFDHVTYQVPKGVPLSWRDGSVAGATEEARSFAAVPHLDGTRGCWTAVAGSPDSVWLCTEASSITRTQEGHATLLSYAGRWSASSTQREAVTACHAALIEEHPDLRGRVRMRWERDGALLVSPQSEANEAMGQCVRDAVEPDEDAEAEAYVVEVYPAESGPLG